MRWDLRSKSLTTDVAGGDQRTILMGVLNLTPDSFSDGGTYLEHAAALDRAQQMVTEGADVIDVGGESTRPGADEVPIQEELARVLPIVETLSADGIVVSIDTSKPEVARHALESGAEIVNDVTGLRNPDMLSVLSETGPGVVVMHMQGDPSSMQQYPSYQDVVGEVRDELLQSAARAKSAGLLASQVFVDPGIGFGKTTQHNWSLLAATDILAATGYGVLIGVSRKRFLGELLNEPDPALRDDATAAAAVACVLRGASALRVHNVSLLRRAATVADAIVRAE
jgi:dihydropteroate synthase